MKLNLHALIMMIMGVYRGIHASGVEHQRENNIINWRRWFENVFKISQNTFGAIAHKSNSESSFNESISHSTCFIMFTEPFMESRFLK